MRALAARRKGRKLKRPTDIYAPPMKSCHLSSFPSITANEGSSAPLLPSACISAHGAAKSVITALMSVMHPVKRMF